MVDNDYVIICLYVDDMLIFGTSLNIVQSTTLFLSANFDMKDLGELKKNNGDPVAQSKYAQIIGSLMYLINFTRPDIAYDVCRLSIYTHNPNREHWSSLDRLMKYLRGTMNYGILYSEFPSTLEGYSDTNSISNSDETKSISGYVFNLGGGAISQKSVKQTIIARSTIELEFVALELAGSEVE
ncbi:secreted RxLR effector protein 161-like [Nicotiana tomentosiformis]|uniref:secreted RxLR effector protein 161-like n=1 Tax=Nicotiana tomentosiformis TaxID=4098 RepID=UPI00388C4501